MARDSTEEAIPKAPDVATNRRSNSLLNASSWLCSRAVGPTPTRILGLFEPAAPLIANRRRSLRWGGPSVITGGREQRASPSPIACRPVLLTLVGSLDLPESPHNLPSRLRMHRQHVDEVGPVVASPVAVAHMPSSTTSTARRMQPVAGSVRPLRLYATMWRAIRRETKWQPTSRARSTLTSVTQSPTGRRSGRPRHLPVHRTSSTSCSTTSGSPRCRPTAVRSRRRISTASRPEGSDTPSGTPPRSVHPPVPAC
jgi:hypothetical protein